MCAGQGYLAKGWHVPAASRNASGGVCGEGLELWRGHRTTLPSLRHCLAWLQPTSIGLPSALWQWQGGHPTPVHPLCAGWDWGNGWTWGRHSRNVSAAAHLWDNHKMPWDYGPASLEPPPWLLPACCFPTRWEQKHPQDWARLGPLEGTG